MTVPREEQGQQRARKMCRPGWGTEVHPSTPSYCKTVIEKSGLLLCAKFMMEMHKCKEGIHV